MNLTLLEKPAADLAAINAAVAEMKGARVSAILVTADSLFNYQRRAVVKAVDGFPAIYQWREFPEAGGLMSFGPNILDAYERVAEYVGFILDGEEVANLPISLPDRLELVVNMKAAQRDGFILSRAEFVRPRLRSRRGKGAVEAAD